MIRNPKFKLITWCAICKKQFDTTEHLYATQCPSCRKAQQGKGGRPRKEKEGGRNENRNLGHDQDTLRADET